MIRKDLLDFINTEMLSWLPRWAERVSGKSVTKCYTGISGLIVGGLEDVRDILTPSEIGIVEAFYCAHIILIPPFSNILVIFNRYVGMFNRDGSVASVAGNGNGDL